MSLLRTSLPPSRAQTLFKQRPRGSQNPLPVPVGNPWVGGRWAQRETRTARTVSGCHPSGSQHLEPRPHARHARTHTHTQRLTLTRTHSHPCADPARGPAPAPAGAPSGAGRPRTQPAPAGGRRRLRADLIFPQPGRPGAGARAEEVALAAGSPTPLPPAPRASEGRRSPGAPGSALPASGHPRRPRRIRPPTPLSPLPQPFGPHPKLHAPLPIPGSTTPRVPPGALSPCPSASLRGAPAPWAPCPFLLAPQPPRRVTRTPSSIRGPRSLRPPSLSHFPRPLFAFLSPPFAAQRRLRSWGRAQGLSRFGGGVNRAGID